MALGKLHGTQLCWWSSSPSSLWDTPRSDNKDTYFFSSTDTFFFFFKPCWLCSKTCFRYSASDIYFLKWQRYCKMTVRSCSLKTFPVIQKKWRCTRHCCLLKNKIKKRQELCWSSKTAQHALNDNIQLSIRNKNPGWFEKALLWQIKILSEKGALLVA